MLRSDYDPGAALGRYTYVMRGLAVVIFVNWKAHHGPGMSNLRESVGKKRICPYPPYVIAAGML